MALFKLLVAVLVAAVGCQANFVVGDFVPTARKAQFHGQRTEWHDVLGTHCPKFGVGRTVALPLPQPTGMEKADDYKMQLSFDGDRAVTPWLQLVGRRAPGAPLLVVELVRSGDVLVSASARVESLSPRDKHYARVAAEFADPTKWPKHLPVHFRWTARHEVDTDRGLMVLFVAGAGSMLIAALSVARTYNRQLRQFVEDVTGDGRIGGGGGGGGLGGGFSGGAEKAD